MSRRFDHVDLRVPNLEKVRGFYEALLPALGFTRRVHVEGWLQFELAGTDLVCREFFGVTESATQVPNESRIAFWADSAAEVDRLATLVAALGAGKVEGPLFEAPGYYAVFFEDPCGNRFEICHRTAA